MFFTINSTAINNYSRLVEIVIKLIRYSKKQSTYKNMKLCKD